VNIFPLFCECENYFSCLARLLLHFVQKKYQNLSEILSYIMQFLLSNGDRMIQFNVAFLCQKYLLLWLKWSCGIKCFLFFC